MRQPTKGAAAALALVPDSLTSEERRMVARYRATSPEWRVDIVDYANMVAKMLPVERPPAPPVRIKLVADDGGIK